MSAEALPRSAAIGRVGIDTAASLLFAWLGFAFCVQAVLLAASAPLWMDEILSLWTARQASPAAVWQALVHGAEFTPPAYDLLLHALLKLGFASPLAIRMPSIVAMLVAAAALALLVRRRSGVPQALLAAGIVLTSGLYAFAVQARPYACVLALFSLALLAWERPAGERPSPARLALLAGLLALAVAFHFYALLLVGALGLAELARRRDASPAVLAAVAAAGATILLWWPILSAASTLSAADAFAPGYYARPRIGALIDSYITLIGWAVVPLLAAPIVARGVVRPAAPLAPGLILLAFPIVVLLFALIVSHSFAARYCLAVVPGLALVTVRLVDRGARDPAAVALLLLVALAPGPLLRGGGEVAKPDRLAALAAARAAPGALPIVVADGLRFFELRENLPRAVADRLVYLDVPGLPSVDPTDRHQALRWGRIDAALPIVDGSAFLCRTPEFLLFSEPGGRHPDDLAAWLRARARLSHAPGDPLFQLVRSAPCAR